MSTRILPTTSLLGTQTLLVDAQGNGDYTQIQPALNAAARYACAGSRWSVRVAPGTYLEQLILKDYVDLLGPGWASRLSHPSGALIATPASCVIANLWLETTAAPIVSLGSAFSGRLELDNVRIDQRALDVPSIVVAGGELLVERSSLAAGAALELTGGSFSARHTVIRNQAGLDGGQNMALYVQHGTLHLSHCLVENVSPAGYCLLIDGAVTGLKAEHTTFRKVDAANAIEVSGALARAMTLACCCGNGPLSALLSGYHDYVYDPSI